MALDEIRTAESILDYLTVKNPNVRSDDRVNARQSDSPHWNSPAYVEPWDEFNFETMEQIFNGTLMQECRDDKNKFRFFDPPLIPGLQDEDSGEPAATAILNLWTNTVVNKALLAVQDTLHPVQWAPQSSSARFSSNHPQLIPRPAQTGPRVQPVRPAKANTIQTKVRKGRTIPDASGITIPTPGMKSKPGPKPPSKLPKEIKPGSKWVSTRDIGNPRGRALGWIGKNKAAPLRQIYQQCIDERSRYGCIVTTKEVVIVRIGPYKRKASSLPLTQDQLAQETIANGLLEYKSIPWNIHRNGDECLEDFRTMTMNLAIWFQHVLAGNNHELARKYAPLKEEVLRMAGQIPDDSEIPDDTASQVTEVTQSSQKQLTVEIPTMGSFVSVAQSHMESLDIPPPRGHESISYLQTSFNTESDLGDSQSIKTGRKKRYVDATLDEAGPSIKRRGRGRPRKET
ncbi:hypothetical protein F5Y03DRAFT_363676 [Xylaria venustula]|nr:hypothetical protein F5Y03DRAFT_363676 [Xylaria venustula]